MVPDPPQGGATFGLAQAETRVGEKEGKEGRASHSPGRIPRTGSPKTWGNHPFPRRGMHGRVATESSPVPRGGDDAHGEASARDASLPEGPFPLRFRRSGMSGGGTTPSGVMKAVT